LIVQRFYFCKIKQYAIFLFPKEKWQKTCLPAGRKKGLRQLADTYQDKFSTCSLKFQEI